jgi:hypothetical protein
MQLAVLLALLRVPGVPSPVVLIEQAGHRLLVGDAIDRFA